MASKATHRKTTVDVIKQQKKNAKRLAGQGRQAASGVSAAASSTTSLAPSSQGSSAGANIAGHLKTGGDTMIGPLAFWRGAYTTIYPSSSNNNTLDISASTGAHSSYVIWYATGAGASNTLEIINGAAFSGQILLLEGTATVTQTIKDRSNTSGGNTGNIQTLDGNDIVLTNSPNAQIVFLMYSDITGKWQQVSNPAGGGSTLLSSTNTWTGINTFQANVSFTGATTTIGDANTDLCTIYAKMGTDVNMGTYDINTLDRLLFDVNGSDAIGSSDYGIGAEASGGSTVGLIYSTPASKTHKFNIGGTPELTISNSYISAATKRITNVTDPTGAQDAATKAYVDANGGGGWNGNATSDLDMNTYDINTIDRLLFNTGGSDSISSSDYGIGAEASGGSVVGMIFSVPSNKTHKFSIGGTPELTISNSYISAASKRITNVSTPTGNNDAANKSYVDSNAGGAGLGDANTWTGTNNFQSTLTASGTFETKTTTKLGDGSNDAIQIYGKTDYKNNTVNWTGSIGGVDVAGYINIKIGGTSRKLYFYQ
jgi:hypothetical protein